jgi:nickel/cobalt exporter
MESSTLSRAAAGVPFGPVEFHPVIAALGFGVMHALTPCAHSWPVLLPLSARAGSGGRPGVLFGIGMLLSSVVVGGLIGAFGGAVLGSAAERVEEVIGVLVAALGAALLLKPGWMHGGHLHGLCAEEAPSVGTGCGHVKHQPFRFFRFGRDAGAFMLGVANMAVPCWSNFAGVGLAVETGSTRGGALVLGVYGLAAAITTVALLVLIHRGLKLTQHLASPRFETAMLRLAGALMLVYGITLLLHLGHTHA